MKNKISSLSKKILLTGLTVCTAFCVTYIIWNVTAFKDTVYYFSRARLAVEAGKLLLLCIAELIIGSYAIERISRAD